MGMRKFIQNVMKYLNIDEMKESGKKKSIKNLLKKLKKLRVKIYKDIKIETDEKRRLELEEELNIVSLQIKKGKKILNKQE